MISTHHKKCFFDLHLFPELSKIILEYYQSKLKSREIDEFWFKATIWRNEPVGFDVEFSDPNYLNIIEILEKSRHIIYFPNNVCAQLKHHIW